jgi:hypothetical protein
MILFSKDSNKAIDVAEKEGTNLGSATRNP